MAARSWAFHDPQRGDELHVAGAFAAEIKAPLPLAVMVGHAFPIFLGFKGGKAVATFFGAFLYLTPIPALAAVIVFVITVTVTRYISAASILAAATFPLHG